MLQNRKNQYFGKYYHSMYLEFLEINKLTKIYIITKLLEDRLKEKPQFPDQSWTVTFVIIAIFQHTAINI